MKVLLIFLLFISSLSVLGQQKVKAKKTRKVRKASKGKGGKVIYEYRKFEEFDFDAIDIEGNVLAPGDLSIQQRYKKSFRNKIPERKEFNRAIEKSIDTLK